MLRWNEIWRCKEKVQYSHVTTNKNVTYSGNIVIFLARCSCHRRQPQVDWLGKARPSLLCNAIGFINCLCFLEHFSNLSKHDKLWFKKLYSTAFSLIITKHYTSKNGNNDINVGDTLKNIAFVNGSHKHKQYNCLTKSRITIPQSIKLCQR